MGKAARREHLTPIRMRGYPLPASGYYLVYDDEVRKLAVAVYASGRKVFKFLYHWRGRTKWLDIGETSIKEARRRGFEYSDQVAKGKDPQAEKMQEKLVGSFRELTERYFSEYAEDNLKSFHQTRYLLEKYVPKRFYLTRVNEIARADVKAVVMAIPKPPLARQVLAALSSVFAWGVNEAEVIQINPCHKIKRGKPTKRERILSIDELPSFWDGFGEHQLAGVALKVLLLTGQRPGEVAAMHRAHIHASVGRDGVVEKTGAWWEMPGPIVPELLWPGTKNAKNHRIWLPQAVMELISVEQNCPTEGLVFGPRPDRTGKAMQAVMIELCKSLKVERATPHDCRRTHGSTITRLLGFGGRAAMNRIQNHVEGGIASVYDRYEYEADTKRVMELVAAELLRVVERRESDNVIPLISPRV